MSSITIRVHADKVLHSDFLGIGINVIPVSLMANNKRQGYNEAHWEMDKKRILMMKPKVARVWFQVDWMEPVKGLYTWESAEMLAFYEYMDVLKSAGTEVQLNFGWKVGRDIQEWFSIPGTEGRISAPRDLDAFAAACSALLYELIIQRGYKNIEYLSFYNEPNGHWDYDAPGDQMLYYSEMLKRVCDRLTADGRRDWVRIWGPEEVDDSWTHYMKDHADDFIDEYTFHIYGDSYEQFSSQIASRRNYVEPKRVGMTEFGWSGDEESGWNSGFANYVIKAANEGIHSALVWQLNGVWCEDPDENVNTNGVYTLWDSLVLGLEPKKSYYAASLLARYIPSHSSVVLSETNSDQVRVAAFVSECGRDRTVLVECNEGEAKDLSIDFLGKPSNKKWYKHAYDPHVTLEGNAIIPTSEWIGEPSASLADSSIDEGYQFILYTTIEPQTQVEISPVQGEVFSGETLQFKANILNNKGGAVWSVVGEPEKYGKITDQGVYTAPSVEQDLIVAVRAVSLADPESYGVALLHVRAGKGERHE
jgi:hypothetical protein